MHVFDLMDSLTRVENPLSATAMEHLASGEHVLFKELIDGKLCLCDHSVINGLLLTCDFDCNNHKKICVRVRKLSSFNDANFKEIWNKCPNHQAILLDGYANFKNVEITIPIPVEVISSYINEDITLHFDYCN